MKLFYLLAISLLTFSHYLNALDMYPIIADASYFIIEGNEHSALFRECISCTNRHATFYTASGDAITTIPIDMTSGVHLKNCLDPHAPKPCATTYAIIYEESGSPKKIASGHFLIFVDKHGNYIDAYRYNPQTGAIYMANKTVFSISDIETIDVSACI